MAISATRLQFLLAQTPYFLSRVQILMMQVAASVLVETGVGATHAARVTYARSVLQNPTNPIPPAAVYLAQSTNVVGTITMEDEGPRTSATDAAILAQITTDWNKLACLDVGSEARMTLLPSGFGSSTSESA